MRLNSKFVTSDGAVKPGVKAGVKPVVSPSVLQSLHQIEHRHFWRLFVFLGLYLLSIITINLWVAQGLSWLFLSPLFLLAAAALHGISLFVHEGVHGLLLRNRHANRALSILCALPVCQNFTAYKILHLQHHSQLGQAGDPDRYRNYTRSPWRESLMYWGRLLIGYPAYVVMIPILAWRQANGIERRWIAFETMLLISLTTLYCYLIPTSVLCVDWLIPMLIINIMVNIRGMSQHTLLEHECDVVHGTRTLIANPVTRFFMCNENYHLEHHLYPAVPWYHLPALHGHISSELINQGAPYLPSYFAFVREFVVANLRRTSVGTISLENP